MLWKHHRQRKTHSSSHDSLAILNALVGCPDSALLLQLHGTLRSSDLKERRHCCSRYSAVTRCPCADKLAKQVEAEFFTLRQLLLNTPVVFCMARFSWRIWGITSDETCSQGRPGTCPHLSVCRIQAYITVTEKPSVLQTEDSRRHPQNAGGKDRLHTRLL